MIELEIVRAREGQLCLWGREEGRILELGRLERGLELADLEPAGSTRRVLDLRLPGRGESLVPALAPASRALFALLGRIAAEAAAADPGEAVSPGPGLAAAASIRLVALLDRFALALIAGGRLLPGLTRGPEGWRARWRAAPDRRDDTRRIDRFVGAMPESLLATDPGVPDAGARSRELLAILDLLTDARARQLLSNTGVADTGVAAAAGPGSSTRADRPSPVRAWLKSLTTADGQIDAFDTELSDLAVGLEEWARLPAPPAAQRPQPSARSDRDEPGDALGHAESTSTDPPASPRGNPPRKLTVTLKTRPPETVARRSDPEATDDESRLFALDGLCEFEWRVAVGDHELTIEELRELAASQLPLIESDGRWTVVEPAQVSAAIEAIERHGERGWAPAGELLRDSVALPSARSTQRSTATPSLRLETEGWLRGLGGDADRELAEPPQPAGLKGRLRPYQRRGFAWLDLLSRLGLGACLADDMGLGKTIQLLALLLAERERAAKSPDAGRAAGPAPTLLICPVSMVGNWQREAERFAPSLRVLVHHGPRRLGGQGYSRAALQADLVITSYSIVTRDRDLLGSIEWDRITLDEAQNIKSRRARQTQAIRSLKARHRIALTGTPVENRLTELHSIMDFLNPGLLGSADAFKQQIARPIEQWRDPDAAAQLRQATAPFILRRLKTDRTIVPDLPEKIEMRTDCLLTKEQASLYQAVVDDLMAAADQPEGIARSGAILAALTRLKQVCNHPAQLLGDDGRRFAGRSGKLQRLEEILEEALAEGDRVLCFTQFSGFGQRLAWHLGSVFDREVLFLHGGSSREERDAMVARFQADDGPSIFILSLRAGGTGLNLTAANQVIHFDRWWNPAVEDQATDRAYRIGQRRNVQVRKLTCVGTLEERIDLLLERKRDLAEMIVGSGESWITELDSAHLHELVALSPEAIDPGSAQRSEPAAKGRPTPGDEALAA